MEIFSAVQRTEKTEKVGTFSSTSVYETIPVQYWDVQLCQDTT